MVLPSLSKNQLQGAVVRTKGVPHEGENAGNIMKIEQDMDKRNGGKKNPGQKGVEEQRQESPENKPQYFGHHRQTTEEGAL